MVAVAVVVVLDVIQTRVGDGGNLLRPFDRVAQRTLYTGGFGEAQRLWGFSFVSVLCPQENIFRHKSWFCVRSLGLGTDLGMGMLGHGMRVAGFAVAVATLCSRFFWIHHRGADAVPTKNAKQFHM